MHSTSLAGWQHEHSFDQNKPRVGERRSLLVLAMTAVMMVIEIAAGIIDGSMALMADGLHMGSHAVALGITVVAYIYARRHAHDERFSFGTGKVNALAGFTSAVLLVLFALVMAWESLTRLFAPVPIRFDEALIVAILGLGVNVASVWVLGGHHEGREHDHHDHSHDHAAHDHLAHGHPHDHDDHNLRAAYMHVLADAFTSLLAIFALLGGKLLGLNWMDPLMGLVGAAVVSRWAWGLLGDTSRVLLDWQAAAHIRDDVRTAIENQDDNRITDLHVWSIGPNMYAALIAVVTDEPKAPSHYIALIPRDLGVVHTTVEVHRCGH